MFPDNGWARLRWKQSCTAGEPTDHRVRRQFQFPANTRRLTWMSAIIEGDEYQIVVMMSEEAIQIGFTASVVHVVTNTAQPFKPQLGDRVILVKQ